MYRHVLQSDITDALIHIRDLFRRSRPLNEHAIRAHKRREASIRDLLSNLPRTNQHPTLKTVLEVAESCALTLEGAHRLFGYDLGKIREYDLRLNGRRTHIEGGHERGRAGEVHRSLGVSKAREGDRYQSWSYRAAYAEKIVR